VSIPQQSEQNLARNVRPVTATLSNPTKTMMKITENVVENIHGKRS
jgi:hypothetical protein